MTKFELILEGLPTPYYRDDFVAIFDYDCHELMPLIPEGSVDLGFADPPYNLGKDFGNNSDKQQWKDYMEWTRDWVAIYWSLLDSEGTSYITISPHSWLVQFYLSLLPLPTRLLPWCKNTGMLHKYAKDWEWFWEVMLYTHKGMAYLFNKPDGIEVRDWWIFPTPWIEHHNRWFKFPAQKPENLLRKIISSSSNPDDIILDPFLGSGTTALIAKELGRKCIGIEIERASCEIAAKRCSQMDAIK